MDFEAFKALKAEGETTPVYEQMLAVLLEIKRIKDQFGAFTSLDKDPESEIQGWLSTLSDDEKKLFIGLKKGVNR